MITLSFPFTEEEIRVLKVGDAVLLSGGEFTGRRSRSWKMKSVYIEMRAVSYPLTRSSSEPVMAWLQQFTKEWQVVPCPSRRSLTTR